MTEMKIYLQKCFCDRRNLIEASLYPQWFLLKLHFPSCPAGHVDRHDWWLWSPSPSVITQRRNNYSSPLPPLPLSPLCPNFSIPCNHFLPPPSFTFISSCPTTSSISFTSILLLLAPVLCLFQWGSLPLIALLITANGQWSPWRWQQWWLT